MLERLKKQLGIQENVSSPELSVLQEQLATLQAQFEGVQSNLENAVTTINELTDNKEKLESTLADALEANAALKASIESAEEKQLQATLAVRKAKLDAAVGTEKSTAAFEALKGLEDAAFEAVVAAMATSVEKEAQSELFTEAGVAGDAEPANQMTAEEKILRAKFSK